jgi:hypothetical protein
MQANDTQPFRVSRKNCLGIEVPEKVLQRAAQHNCVGGSLWLYPDGNYGKSPHASINCSQARAFRRKNVERFKLSLGDGWVAFISPTSLSRQPGSKPRCVQGRGTVNPCVICGENRVTEDAHFPKPDRFGGTATIKLCPSHHRLLDLGRLSDAEFRLIRAVIEPNCPADEPIHKFIDRAHQQCYPYSAEAIRGKAVRQDDIVPREIRYVISQDPCESSEGNLCL